MNTNKLPTPIEFNQQLHKSAKGDGPFVKSGIPSGELARKEWQRIVDAMKKISLKEKKEWMGQFLDKAGILTPTHLSFEPLLKHVNEQHEELSALIESKQLHNEKQTTDKSPLDELSPDQKKKLDRVLLKKDNDGRSKYTVDEYRMYLAVHLIEPNISRRSKAKEAAKYLNNDKAERMKETSDSRLSDWENWLY